MAACVCKSNGCKMITHLFKILNDPILQPHSMQKEKGANSRVKRLFNQDILTNLEKYFKSRHLCQSNSFLQISNNFFGAISIFMFILKTITIHHKFYYTP